MGDMPSFRHPEPDPFVDSFRGAVVRLEDSHGDVTGHLVSNVVRNWVPWRTWEWMVSCEIRWSDGSVDRDEDVAPWTFVGPIASGTYSRVGEGDPHAGEYTAVRLPPEDAERWIHRHGIEIPAV